MRKSWYIAGASVVALGALVAALMVYALVNLNAIIRDNQAALLARASQALGRKITVTSLKARVGLGATIIVEGLQVADDPAFSALPFASARQVRCGVELLPLLSGRLHLSQLAVLAPELHVRRLNGLLNVSTLGRHPTDPPAPAAGAPPASPNAAPAAQLMVAQPHRAPAALNRVVAGLRVASLMIEDGTVVYQDSGAPAITIHHVAVTADHLRLDAPVPVSVALAAWSDQPNLSAHGWVGPLAQGRVLEAGAIPFNLNLSLGPLALDGLRQVAAIADRIPPQLVISAPLSAQFTLSGTPAHLAFSAASDLSAARVQYGSLFAKPAGMNLALSGRGLLSPATIEVQSATARIGGQEASVRNLAVSGGVWHGALDLEHFALSPLAALIGPLRDYAMAGTADAHLLVAWGGPVPVVNGIIALRKAGVSLKGGTLPAVSEVDAQLRLDGNRAVLAPASFKIGSALGQLAGQAQSLRPLQAQWTASASNIKLAQFIPGRASDERIDQIGLEGGLEASDTTTRATLKALSPSGLVAGVPYQQLELDAVYEGQTLTIETAALQAYGGSLQGQGQISLDHIPAFRFVGQARSIDLAQALAAQHDKDAGAVQGTVNGELKLAGRGTDWARIQPTLSGNGQGSLIHGKLVGINLVASAMAQVDRVPGIGGLVTAALVARHPELFKSRDTDLGHAQMTFTVAGSRLVSHDITAQSNDYRMTGAGWFGFDRRLNLDLSVLLSAGLSRDLQAQKKNVVYLMNPAGQIEVPVLVTGQLPRPVVRPDVQVMVARAAQQALKQNGRALLGGLGKRLNNLLGGIP